ncbi:Uu.00g042800.m01.CDS01 [Anthostomella pinea]|uniref:Uu.00g042800.m01.CDS01 n=1 Tax=Anthostomella pinea TaxID=933095 RepID=A0AAI8VB56_9PEZI|nr:Uu.00g042800.m01.CDS01 [Anthostomella pinea]
MGDDPSSSASAIEYTTPETLGSAYPDMALSDRQSPLPPGPSPANSSAFQAQYQQLYGPSPNAYSSQIDMSHTQGSGRQGPYNMSAMANALPQSGYRPGYTTGQQQQQQQPRYNHGAAPNMMPQVAHYPGQSVMPQPLGGQQYYMAQHPQMPQYYNAQLSPNSQHQSSQQSGLPPRHNMNMGYYTNAVLVNQSQQQLPTGYYYPPSGQFSAPNSAVHGQMAPTQFLMPDGTPGGPRGLSPSQGSDQADGVAHFGQIDGMADNRSNVVRGPPRKPRQSGHAIWIGNLPPQTELMSLVHHVCKEAAGLESLFLISKSNCAFANFKDEPSCVAAQQKLHDSKFQSVRLVSRLRKSTVEGVTGQTAPTGPAATSPGGQPASSGSPSSPQSKVLNSSFSVTGVPSEPKNTSIAETNNQRDKFFILKSLTVEDLELSIRNGVWATQSHNEVALNNAFKAADNVYLVFSANKSGEYFGYARMVSRINDDPAAAIEFAPKAQVTSNLDLPKAIPTEATEACPKGRIIDDSARGTIFWEVERDEVDGIPEADESEDDDSARSAPEDEGGSKAWGKPFKLEWLSTTRLPFYRTRGLRNPWNSNREVKIARDGTELEPSVGRRLIGLFNRIQTPAPLVMPGMRPGVPGVPGISMAAGFPPPMAPPYHQ